MLMDGGDGDLGITGLFKGHFPTSPWVQTSSPQFFWLIIIDVQRYLCLLCHFNRIDVSFSLNMEFPISLHITYTAHLSTVTWNSQGKNTFPFHALGQRPMTPAPKTSNTPHHKSCGLRWLDLVGWQTSQLQNKKVSEGFLIPKWLAKEKTRYFQSNILQNYSL